MAAAGRDTAASGGGGGGASAVVQSLPHYLRLCDEPLKFHPVDSITSVFFDEANKQVFVTQEGSSEVVVHSLDQSYNAKIKLGMYFTPLTQSRNLINARSRVLSLSLARARACRFS